MATHVETGTGGIRFGLAGLGKAGRGIVPSILKYPNATLSAVADLNEDVLAAFAQKFTVATHTNIESLCASDQVDAVYIATPTQFHTEHAILAAESGKHIIVEKPIALTIADADTMIAAAKQNGVHLIITHSNGYAPPIRKIREIVQSGELGRVRMIHNWYFTDWLYRPRMREEMDTTLGGGVTLRQGSHQFDIIRMIGGGLVRSVRATTGVWDSKRPTEGSHTAFLEFVDGTVATAVYSGYDRFHSTELTFGIGEGGKLAREQAYGHARRTLNAASDAKTEASLKRDRANLVSLGPVSEQHQPFFGLTIVSCEKGDIRQSPDGLYVYAEDTKREVPVTNDESGRDWAIRELCEAVIARRPPLHDGHWGRANLEVCLAVLESARTRKEIYLSHQIAATDRSPACPLPE